MIDRTALKIALDKKGMSKLADEVDSMTPLAVEQLGKLFDGAFLTVPCPRILQPFFRNKLVPKIR